MKILESVLNYLENSEDYTDLLTHIIEINNKCLL